VTITHVDRDHLADLERTVAALRLELFAAQIVHATDERELRETRDLLAAYRVTAATQQEWIEKRSGVERRTDHESSALVHRGWLTTPRATLGTRSEDRRKP
jgi:hypothetical protein